MGVCSHRRTSLITVLAAASLCLFACSSLAVVTFERTYGGISEDWGGCVQQTPDGGYIIVGNTWSCTRLHDIYMVKTDSLGDVLWTRTHGEPSEDFGLCVQGTEDSGYIIVGYRRNPTTTSDYDAYLVKTDSSGDTLWTRTYGGGKDDEGRSVRQTRDGGYIIAGSTQSFGVGRSDAYLVKTDSLGAMMWTRVYGGRYQDFAYSVQQTQDGGYILAGHTYSFDEGQADVYLVKTDSLGFVVWTRVYGGSYLDRAYSVQQTQDGGYIVAGTTQSFGAGYFDVYLIRADAMGDVVWERTYGGAGRDGAKCVRQTQDAGYIVAGGTRSFGAAYLDFYLIRVDSIGDQLWMARCGGFGWDGAEWVEQTQDGGFIIAGYTESFGLGVTDIYVIKTDGNGEVGITEDGPRSGVGARRFFLLQNHPNPFHHTTAISYSLPATLDITLAIYDISGRLVETLVYETQQPGIHQVRWNRKDNPSGVYFYRLKAGEFVETRKMVVID